MGSIMAVKFWRGVVFESWAERSEGKKVSFLSR